MAQALPMQYGPYCRIGALSGDEMPPPNPGRVIDAESTIAKRVKIEREQRDWSLEATAQAMTAVGCPIHSTAILKIERTDSRRRIQGDEIAAFARVFGLEVGDLFRSIEEVETETLRARYDEWGQALGAEVRAGRQQNDALAALLDAARSTPNLEERGELGQWLVGVLANWTEGRPVAGARPLVRKGDGLLTSPRFDVGDYRVHLEVEPAQ